VELLALLVSVVFPQHHVRLVGATPLLDHRLLVLQQLVGVEEVLDLCQPVGLEVADVVYPVEARIRA